MTQEEKAKAYDKAIETARKINSGEGVAAPPDWTICEVIFPELKESEDERIRNGLIALLKFSLEDGSAIAPGFNETKEQALTWLEKQGEPLNESVYDTEDKEIYQAISIGLTDVFNECGWSDFGGIPIENIQKWLEKQGEQRSKLVDFGYNAKDSDLQEVTYFIPNGFHAEMEGNKVVIKQGEQKPAKWTEEDEAHLHSITTHLGQWIERHPNTCGADIQCENLAWLESLKQRMEGSK